MSAPVVPNPDWVEEALADAPPLLTVPEAAKLLRMSVRSFYRLVSTGRLKAFRAADAGSSRHLVPRSEVGRYLRTLAGAT